MRFYTLRYDHIRLRPFFCPTAHGKSHSVHTVARSQNEPTISNLRDLKKGVISLTDFQKFKLEMAEFISQSIHGGLRLHPTSTHPIFWLCWPDHPFSLFSQSSASWQPRVSPSSHLWRLFEATHPPSQPRALEDPASPCQSRPCT